MEITVDVEDMKQLTLTVMGMTVDAGMTTDIATKKNMHMHTETIVDADMTMMITDMIMDIAMEMTAGVVDMTTQQ